MAFEKIPSQTALPRPMSYEALAQMRRLRAASAAKQREDIRKWSMKPATKISNPIKSPR